jgi:acetylornithine deacetylase
VEIHDLTAALIDIPSPTGEEQAVVRFLHDYLQAAGFDVQLQEVANGRANVYARVGEPHVVLSTHTDTVLPHVAVQQDEKFIYGRGACDAKGIVAAQIKAAERLRAAGVSNFGLLFVVGEEHGSDGARTANTLPNRCRFLINGEPTENRVALGSKGALRAEVLTHGRAAHSAYPERGESAITKLLDVLNDIRVLSLPQHQVLGETTCNIGTIAGGIQANVIPDWAKAELMFRTVTGTAVVKNILEQTVRLRADIRYRFECEPVMLDALAGFGGGIYHGYPIAHQLGTAGADGAGFDSRCAHSA